MLYIMIWGTKGVTYTKNSGSFRCPRCGPDVTYRHRRCRRFFHLYWIPLIPLRLAGEYVECKGCKATYKMKVLDYDPDQAQAGFEAEFARAIKQVLVRMMIADGHVDRAELEAVPEIYERVTGEHLPLTEVVDLFTGIAGSPQPLTDVLRDVAPLLNEQGKSLVIRAAFFVAASDGQVDQSEYALLINIGEALDMQKPEIEGAVGALSEAA